MITAHSSAVYRQQNHLRERGKVRERNNREKKQALSREEVENRGKESPQNSATMCNPPALYSPSSTLCYTCLPHFADCEPRVPPF
ncbi:hypothetical protein GmHk_07G018891 [Glycine max]|nr:hypothetical protein GmHk_07G018891 [Glycine max]